MEDESSGCDGTGSEEEGEAVDCEGAGPQGRPTEPSHLEERLQAQLPLENHLRGGGGKRGE